MSPHVGNFVQDLVEMAKAMDELPKVQAERNELGEMYLVAQETIQAREEAIIGYKAEIEKHLATIRTLEVARDDAELRFLELDEKAHKVLSLLGDIQGDAAQAMIEIDPPKPEPQPEPVNVPITEGQDEPIVHMDQHVEAQGQSEPDPTASSQLNTSVTEQQVDLSQTAEMITASSPMNALPSSGAYADLHYYDHPSYVSRHDWLSGGGTDESYDWKPNRSIFG